MKSVKYLEKLKQRENWNDSQLAKELGLTKGAISNYIHGTRVMDDEACLAVALKLQINPMEIIGAACIDRAEKTGQKSLWEVFMSRTASAASAALMAIVVAVNLFLTPTPSEAAPVLKSPAVTLGIM